MGTAKMPRTSDPAGSADDLISELARLMAEDAQGDRPALSGANTSGAAENHGSTSVDTLSRPEQDTSPSARLSASGGAGLYDKDELRDDSPISRYPSPPATNVGRSAISAPRPTPRFQSPPPAAPEMESNPAAMGHQTNMSSDDLGYENDVLGEADPFESIPALETLDSDIPAAGLQSEPEQVNATEHDPIADLIAAQLQQSGIADRPASIETDLAPEYEETDQFGGEQPHPAEVDNFDVSPVFGLGGAKPQPKRTNDPLAEIQSLIGDAVHVSAPQGTEDVEVASPVVASPVAASPVVASPAVDSNVNDAALAAEAAIAAATAATADDNASEDDIHQVLARRAAEAASVADIDIGDAEHVDSRKTLGQRLMGPAIAAALLLAIGASLWWVFGSGPNVDAEAPVLSADTSAVKAEPKPVVADVNEAERSVVFDELSGNNVTTDTQQLLSRDQTEVALEPENLLAPENIVPNIVPTGVARVVGVENEAAGLANRKVRTVTVRPDGTIVSGDDSIAGGEVLPVERPDVPALPEGTQTAASEFVNEPIIAEVTENLVDTTAITNPVSALVQPDTLSLQSPDLETIGVAGTLASPAIAPVPRPRPNNRPTLVTTPVFSQPLVTNSIATTATPTSNDQAVDLIASLASEAVAPPVILAQPTSVSSVVQGNSAAAYVQLSSQRSQEAARNSLAEIKRRHGNLLTGGELEVQRAEVPERGTFFRVRMPANSIDVANSVCASVKANGGDCFVRAN